MLARAARIRTPEDFRRTVRDGVRVGRSSLVIHMVRTDSPPSRAGFVVSRAIGGAVVRNRVKRQLRHLVAARLASTGFPVDAVVRALPPAAAGVAEDFEGAWQASLERLAAA